MFAKFFERRKARRIQSKLEARLNDEKLYAAGPPPSLHREIIFRDLIDGNDFSVIGPTNEENTKRLFSLRAMGVLKPVQPLGGV